MTEYNRDAMDLANWWEEHVEADKRRELEEKEIQKKKRLIKLAVSKLTPEELEAIKSGL